MTLYTIGVALVFTLVFMSCITGFVLGAVELCIRTGLISLPKES